MSAGCAGWSPKPPRGGSNPSVLASVEDISSRWRAPLAKRMGLHRSWGSTPRSSATSRSWGGRGVLVALKARSSRFDSGLDHQHGADPEGMRNWSRKPAGAARSSVGSNPTCSATCGRRPEERGAGLENRQRPGPSWVRIPRLPLFALTYVDEQARIRTWPPGASINTYEPGAPKRPGSTRVHAHGWRSASTPTSPVSGRRFPRGSRLTTCPMTKPPAPKGTGGFVVLGPKLHWKSTRLRTGRLGVRIASAPPFSVFEIAGTNGRSKTRGGSDPAAPARLSVNWTDHRPPKADQCRFESGQAHSFPVVVVAQSGEHRAVNAGEPDRNRSITPLGVWGCVVWPPACHAGYRRVRLPYIPPSTGPSLTLAPLPRAEPRLLTERAGLKSCAGSPSAWPCSSPASASSTRPPWYSSSATTRSPGRGPSMPRPLRQRALRPRRSFRRGRHPPSGRRSPQVPSPARAGAPAVRARSTNTRRRRCGAPSAPSPR